MEDLKSSGIEGFLCMDLLCKLCEEKTEIDV